MSVLSRLVEAARKQYGEISRPHVIVHAVTAVSFFGGDILLSVRCAQ